jgi:tetratricopeptide (TPR) repeat protein
MERGVFGRGGLAMAARWSDDGCLTSDTRARYHQFLLEKGTSMLQRQQRLALALAGFLAAVSPGLCAGSDNSSLNNDPEFRRASDLVKAEKWVEALPVLLRLEADIKTSADIYNLLGVTYRKLKDYPMSKRHYDRALELDYAHLPTLEYQGEWFIETGDMASARSNLDKLKMFCGTCHEYQDLAEAIARAEKAGKPGG